MSARSLTERERGAADPRPEPDLERVVSSLRAQNAHLDATLSAQKQTLDALRVSRSAAAAAAAAPAVATSPPGPYALRSEVQDLKHALAALGYEVDGVRTVVEELLREKEERDAGKRWEAEEAERRADLQAQAQAPAPAPGAPFARDDSIVGTPQSPLDHHLSPVEESVKSWVSREGIEMQKREQREAAGRHQYRRGAAKVRRSRKEYSRSGIRGPVSSLCARPHFYSPRSRRMPHAPVTSRTTFPNSRRPRTRPTSLRR